MFNYDLSEIKESLSYESEALSLEEDAMTFERLMDLSIANENKITDAISSSVQKAKNFISLMFSYVSRMIRRFTKTGKDLSSDLDKMSSKLKKKLKSFKATSESVDYISFEELLVHDNTTFDFVNAMVSLVVAIPMLYGAAATETRHRQDGSTAKRIFWDWLTTEFIYLIPDLIMICAGVPWLVRFIGYCTTMSLVMGRRERDSIKLAKEAMESMYDRYLSDILTPIARKKILKKGYRYLWWAAGSSFDNVKEKAFKYLQEVLAKRDWVTPEDIVYNSTGEASKAQKAEMEKLGKAIESYKDKLKWESMSNINDIVTMRMDKVDLLRVKTKEFEELLVPIKNLVKAYV